ncbi:glycosyltransferase family 2 protein [Salinivibrio sp. KP-1]|uniref:glycosyltransferase family 2 protein n=1 Tax=Salinivibrio sp. KP-1 TaxID=1406902 RepID=UPI00061474FE|nr:glycosyltransferase family 2 protein [Salinivibrio sp. KP-1]KKA44690.1 hypothetical protein WN56_09145 [Salinivibrio sp. KP-1]
MYNPKVSIIIPVYNVEAFIAQCLESVLNQTYENLEIICINDGSTDSSKDICDSFAQRDNRVRVIDQKNKGLSGARNSGIKDAKGEFLFFLDSDDWLALSAINSLVKESKGYDVISGGVLAYNESNGDFRRYKKRRSSKIDLKKDFFQLEIVVWNKLYRKEIFNGIRFKEGLIHEDEEFYWQVFSRSPKIKIIDEDVIFYRERSGSITKKSSYSDEYQYNYISIIDSIHPLSQKKSELAYPFYKTCLKFLKQLKRKNAPFEAYEQYIKRKYGVEDAPIFKLKLRLLKLSHWCVARVARFQD